MGGGKLQGKHKGALEKYLFTTKNTIPNTWDKKMASDQQRASSRFAVDAVCRRCEHKWAGCEGTDELNCAAISKGDAAPIERWQAP